MMNVISRSGFPACTRHVTDVSLQDRARAHSESKASGKTRRCCNFSANHGSCKTEDCDGLLQCAGAGGALSATLAELTLDSPMDFYDISLIDDYNLPVSVVPSGQANSCQKVRCVANSSRICPTPLQVSLVNRFLVWQSVFLAGAIVVGAFIRRRQWQRICRDSREPGSLNIVDRIEKVEEDLRSSTTIVRVLSRQLEKLGIRFRVTRKTLKEPINEAATLAQKNSEATRALAMQEEMLERELAEIQNVLLAMQEQQKRQLELIHATGRSGKLRKPAGVVNRRSDNGDAAFSS